MSADGRQAELKLEGVPVIDQPEYPALDAPARPARISYRLIWKAIDDKKVVYEDKYKHFRFEGYRAAAHLAAQVEVPSIDFSWKSDPIETSKAAFAIIGTEVNGKYYLKEPD